MYRILIVDDVPQVRSLTSRALRQCGLSCDTAADGEQALGLFNAAAYDAVVTDLRMPRRNGHALAIELLDRPHPPAVIVVTGLAEPRLVRELVKRGVEDVVHKPVDYNVLAMKLLLLAEKHKQKTTSMLNDTAEQQPQLSTIERSLVELTDIFAETLDGLFHYDTPLNDPPKAVSNFITRFNELEADSQAPVPAGHNKRRKRRARCHSNAIATPVDENFVKVGDPFCAALRDVSESGLRMLHTRAINCEYMALDWKAETLRSTKLQVVAKVMRCQPLSPFYDIGGQFVMSD